MAKGQTVLGCLRTNKKKLSPMCNSEIFERQEYAADDWRTDTQLAKACAVRVCCGLHLSCLHCSACS